MNKKLYKYMKFKFIFAFIIMLSYNCLKASELLSDEALIKNLYENWHIAVESSNINGYIASLDKNITLIPPGGPIITGIENYRKFLGPVFNSATYKINAGDYDIEIIGDLAIVKSRQTVSLTFIGNKNKVKSEGALQKDITTSDYLDILQRQSNGSWKCLVHTWQEVK